MELSYNGLSRMVKNNRPRKLADLPFYIEEKRVISHGDICKKNATFLK